MKKLILGTLITFMMVACNYRQKEIDRLSFQKDSIQQEKDSVVAERDSFFNVIAIIESNFETIKQTQLGIIDQSHTSEGSAADSKMRIEQSFNLIRDKIEQNRIQIEKLQQDLKNVQGQAAHYKGLVQRLQQDLEAKTKEIEELRIQLGEKDSKIQEMGGTISSLNKNKDSLNAVTRLQAEAMRVQDEELNGAWYTMATKKELKNKGLKEGDLKKNSINKSNFKKVDIREFSQLELNSTKAKLYTSHPQSSYTLTKVSDKDKNLVLKIKDYKSFWSNSRILIIEIK